MSHSTVVFMRILVLWQSPKRRGFISYLCGYSELQETPELVELSSPTFCLFWKINVVHHQCSSCCGVVVAWNCCCTQSKRRLAVTVPNTPQIVVLSVLPGSFKHIKHGLLRHCLTAAILHYWRTSRAPTLLEQVEMDHIK